MKRLTLEDYQKEAGKTAIYKGRGTFAGLQYCVLKLNGEAGEVAEKVGKLWRDTEILMENPTYNIRTEAKEKLLIELGDALWYIQQAATELGTSLESIALMNLEKLSKRAAQGTLSGAGDER